MNATIKKLEVKDCSKEMLKDFNRYQEVKHSWRKIDGKWHLIENQFIEQWDEPKKQNVIVSLIECINAHGIVLGAYVRDLFIGFSSVKGELFGMYSDFVQLDMLHVSYGFRGNGIGRQLFLKTCPYAKVLGAKRLYISAHSSEGSHAFYKAMGCHETTEIDRKLFEEEPYDCHMEYSL